MVTQVVVTLEPHKCSQGVVVELVKQQVGYDIILLDSKCFPVLDNETTRSTEYWKSTRKILAASMSLYSRLKGTSADPGQALLSDESGVRAGLPRAKRKCPDEEGKLDIILERLDQVHTSIGILEDHLQFVMSLADVFDCVICKGTTKKTSHVYMLPGRGGRV